MLSAECFAAETAGGCPPSGSCRGGAACVSVMEGKDDYEQKIGVSQTIHHSLINSIRPNIKQTSCTMDIFYSDFEKEVANKRMKKLNFNIENIKKEKDTDQTGFVLVKTRDLKNISILRWRPVMSADHVKYDADVKSEPESFKNGIEKAIEKHDKKRQIVIDFRFHIDIKENDDVDWPNQHIIAITDWETHDNVTTESDVADALEWIAKGE